jgi:aryl-alcohol dehydrogenase-like predicted oxidoreductase
MDEMKIALGAMEFGTRIDERTSFALLDSYVGAGGVWIDTADAYAFWHDPSGRGGQSEALLGRWFAARPGVRERVRISTKVGCEPLSPGSYPEATEGLSREAIDAGVTGSLRRMGIDHIDMYWAHRDDRGTPLEETVAALGVHAAEGRVGRIGLSNYALWRAERARGIAGRLGCAAPTALQLRYSYLQPRPLVRDNAHDHRFGWITDEVLDYAANDPSVELWAYSPLMSGAFERTDRPPHEAFDHPGSTRRLAVLEKRAADLGVSRSALVLAWMIAGTPFVRPVVGVSTQEQLADAIEGARLTLEDGLVEELDRPW